MITSDVFESVLRTGLAPIGSFLDDESVTEISINGPSEIFVERRGQLSRTEVQFDSAASLLAALRIIAQYAGRPFDEMHPILEARLPDGSRVEALLPPVAPDGPAVSIRRFSKERLSLSRLLEFGALTEEAAELLRILIECKQNVVIAGGTGSGKTSMLNALSALVPSGERIIVIEDARELKLQGEHVVQLEARPPDARGKGAVTIRDLFKASLRMRPDRIVIGEIRGGEALDLVQAMTSGHGGCLTTVHATFPADTLSRLETLALMGSVDLPLQALRAQLSSAVDIVVQTARMRDGRRRVTHISELLATDVRHGYRIQDLFSLRQRQVGHAALATTELLPTGARPACMEVIDAHGFDLPKGVKEAIRCFAAQRRGDRP